MARSKKSPKDIAKAEAVSEPVVNDAADAVQIEAGEDEAQTSPFEVNVPSEPEIEIEVLSETPDRDAEDAKEASTPEAEELEDVVEESLDVDESVTEEDTLVDLPDPVVPQVVVKKRGIAPMLLGGVLCVGLGYVGANFIKPEGWPFPGANVTALNDRMSELEMQLTAAQTQAAQMAEVIETLRGDMSVIDAKIADIDVSNAVAPIEAALATIDQRLTAVEAAPVAEAIVSPEATAAYERQLNDMQTLLNTEVARLKEAKKAAENEEANAAKASAVSRLQEAITTGQPYEAVLKNLDIEVPVALSAPAAQGVATLQEIATSFGEAADLAIVESAKTGADSQGWMDRFLRTQLGLRSLTPKDGTSPDAILSRAEQAIRDNDLQTALTEISTLPDVGQAVMTDWVAIVQTRLDVTNALSAMLAQ